MSSLEKIFIENRIYRDIEECETWDDVIEAIDIGLKKYVATPSDPRKKGDKRKIMIRDITTDDIVKLTEIKIKRISKYNSFKADELISKIEEDVEERPFCPPCPEPKRSADRTVNAAVIPTCVAPWLTAKANTWRGPTNGRMARAGDSDSPVLTITSTGRTTISVRSCSTPSSGPPMPRFPVAECLPLLPLIPKSALTWTTKVSDTNPH